MAQKVQEFTLTGALKHKDDVVLPLEYRRDSSDIPFFVKNRDGPGRPPEHIHGWGRLRVQHEGVVARQGVRVADQNSKR
jgi:hypothetical protein